MYNSLKKWLTIPLVIHQCESVDGAGDKTWVTPSIDTTCYAVQSVKSIVNKDGVEVMSSTHLYLDGAIVISNNDEVTFDNARMPVQAISTYYEGNSGVKDILVVYL